MLIDDLPRQAEKAKAQKPGFQLDLFADFNGLPDEHAKTEFYQHEGKWQNRMILGDSLRVMASPAEREGLRGKVQYMRIDPPYYQSLSDLSVRFPLLPKEVFQREASVAVTYYWLLRWEIERRELPLEVY